MEPTLFKSYSGALGLRAERHLIFSPSLLHRSFLLLLQQRSGQDSYTNMGRSVHFVIVALMAVAHASASIVPRGPQTNATCSSDYDWTDNNSGFSPCLLASYLIGSCLTGGACVNYNSSRLLICVDRLQITVYGLYRPPLIMTLRMLVLCRRLRAHGTLELYFFPIILS